MIAEPTEITPVSAELERIVPLIKKTNTSSTLVGLKPKTTDIILLNTENGITELVKNLKDRDLSTSGIDDISAEELSHLPTSSTGIVIYYLLEGLKRDFNINLSFFALLPCKESNNIWAANEVNHDA